MRPQDPMLGHKRSILGHVFFLLSFFLLLGGWALPRAEGRRPAALVRERYAVSATARSTGQPASSGCCDVGGAGGTAGAMPGLLTQGVPAGPTGPLDTPFRTLGTLSGLTLTH